jgi:hypothetical protein
MPLIVANASGATFVQFGDTAGLPYPDTDAAVLLKEAIVSITTESRWIREAQGFEPHHNVLMKINSRYTIQNEADQKVRMSLNVPLPVSLNQESLRFVVNDQYIDYASVEYDNPRQQGTGLQLFRLDMELDANSETVLY